MAGLKDYQISVYVANLGKYVEGVLQGAWITLPMPAERLQDTLKTEVGLGGRYEEYAIHDYEDMEALVDAVNGSKDHPILKAVGFHAMFENIHPFTDGNGRTGRQILNLMLMAAGYRPVAIKHDAGRSYGKSLEAWQVDGDPKPFISQLVQCVDQEERAVAEIVGRLRENPFSENAIDGIGLEDGPARGRSL